MSTEAKETCLNCIPIEKGVKIIGFFQIFAAGILVTFGFIWPTLLSLTAPMVFLYMIIAIVFFFENCYSSTRARKYLLIAYILLIVIARNFYYMWIIMND